MVGRSLFLYPYRQKEGVHMDSYDNDIILMLLDDDLFPVEDDVPVLQSKSDSQ